MQNLSSSHSYKFSFLLSESMYITILSLTPSDIQGRSLVACTDSKVITFDTSI